MKAHINGITIEGTPHEIAEYQRLQKIEEGKKALNRLNYAARELSIALAHEAISSLKSTEKRNVM